MTTPEQEDRTRIDAPFQSAGWSVQYVSEANIHAARGVAIREFPVMSGHGFADYLHYAYGNAAGAIEAKKEGVRLSGVETLAHLSHVGRVKRSGPDNDIGEKSATYPASGTVLSRLRQMPPLHEESLSPVPIKAIGNLQQSLKEDRLCARRAWQLDDDFEYGPEELDRRAQTPDQIRTIDRTLRDRWQTDLFPQRQDLPKTLVFAKDDNHAEAIVGILREEWGRGNEFAQKITHRTTGSKPEELIKACRTSYYPRIAFTDTRPN